MVAIDGFRATIQIADARTYRMLLAIEADGAPIPRTGGGPIFLIHPFTESGPELRAKYPDSILGVLCHPRRGRNRLARRCRAPAWGLARRCHRGRRG